MNERPERTNAHIARRAMAMGLMVSFANLLACTEYVPVSGRVDAAAQPVVRVTLTEQGRVDAAPRIGLRAVRIEGVLQSMTDSSLSLSVRKVSREGGIEDNYAGEPLSLTRRDFDAVEKSKTSLSRSILVAGAVIASALLIARGAGDLSGGGGGGPPPPGK